MTRIASEDLTNFVAMMASSGSWYVMHILPGGLTIPTAGPYTFFEEAVQEAKLQTGKLQAVLMDWYRDNVQD